MSLSLYIVLFLLIDNISEKPVPDAYLGTGLGIVSFLSCIGGIAQIYKKEMPWMYGNPYKGNLAVVSGILLVILCVVVGVIAMMTGFNSLFFEISGVN